MSLCGCPQDRVHHALNDATGVLHHVDFCLVPGLNIAQFVLPEKSEQPGVILLDKAHHWHGRKLRRAYPGAKREIRYTTIRRREVHRTVQVEFRIDQVRFRLANLRSGLRLRRIGGKEFALEVAEIALRLLKVSPLAGSSRGQGGELLDAFFRQVDARSQRSFFVCSVVELILRAAQGGLGGFFRRLERHRVDLEKQIAFLDGPVWFNWNLRYLTGHTRHYRDYIILRPHVGRRRRTDVHEQNQNRQRDDRDGDDNYLASDVPRQQLEFEKDQPNDDRVDDKENEFHYALTLTELRFASSSAIRVRSFSISLSSSVTSWPTWLSDSSTSVP